MTQSDDLSGFKLTGTDGIDSASYRFSHVSTGVDGYDEESFLFYGRSRGDSIDVDGKVYFATEEEVTPGDIIKVKILDADEYDLTGQAEVI